jgi:hypothetical protein
MASNNLLNVVAQLLQMVLLWHLLYCPWKYEVEKYNNNQEDMGDSSDLYQVATKNPAENREY